MTRVSIPHFPTGDSNERPQRPQIADTDSAPSRQRRWCLLGAACRYHALRLRASPRLFIFLHARTQSMYKWFAISIPGQGAHCRCENCVPRVAFTLPPEATRKQGPRHVRLQVLHFVLPNASASHMQAHSHIYSRTREDPTRTPDQGECAESATGTEPCRPPHRTAAPS